MLIIKAKGKLHFIDYVCLVSPSLSKHEDNWELSPRNLIEQHNNYELLEINFQL